MTDPEKEALKNAEFETLEKIVDADEESLSTIFKTKTNKIKDKANELLLQDAFSDDFNDPTMEKSLVELSTMTNSTLRALSENNVKKLEELAEMSVGELMDIASKISESEASALIIEGILEGDSSF